MKLKIALLLISTAILYQGYSQSSKSSYDKFLSDVAEGYQELSKPPIKNYWEVLTNTAKYLFTPDNPLFLDAIRDRAEQYNGNEEQALDSLFTQVFRFLKANALWNANREVLKDHQNMFQIYNSQLCPCITSGVTRKSELNEVLKVQKTCIADIITDTAFLYRLKSVAGENTLNDMFKLQQFLAMYMYGNCDIINYKLNEVLYGSFVHEQYRNAISMLRRREGEKVLRLFAEKKYDSLALIFPSFKKYTKQLTEANNKIKEPGMSMRSYYFQGRGKPAISRTYISITDSVPVGIDVTFFNSENKLRSVITSMEIKRLEKSDGLDEIIEIKEVSVGTEKEKN